MIFNSIQFALFFSIIFIIYWALKDKVRIQNLLLLIASYIFYACWDWRFLFLLAGCSVVSYIAGLKLQQAKGGGRKIWLWASIILEVSALFYFKYTNFFITSFIDLCNYWGIQAHVHTLNILLPVGVSFYIFRTISYILDIYYEKIKPEPNCIAYFVYVAFFPSLISGPIDRAKLLIPQLKTKRSFDYNLATDGIRQIVWGLFKKIVIADNAGIFTNQIFGNYQNMSSGILFLGALLYTIQLYSDFSGYSDMAIGLSKLLGLRITQNFCYPFFAQNIADYWRRWHISLTRWLTDFIFTPLSIRYRNWEKTGLIFSIIITFLVSGIWHGANWTFVLWGLLHGCYYIPLILKGAMNKTKKISKGALPTLKEFRNMAGMFFLLMFTNIIFRSESISDSFQYITSLFSFSTGEIPEFLFSGIRNLISTMFFFLLLVIVEWINREKEHGLVLSDKIPALVRWGIYYGMSLIILFFQSSQQTFIYFQF